MSLDRYRLSFTTGGLFLHESVVVAEHYLVSGDWKLTRELVRADNLLQVRTSAAATRISKELIARLEFMTIQFNDVVSSIVGKHIVGTTSPQLLRRTAS